MRAASCARKRYRSVPVNSIYEAIEALKLFAAQRSNDGKPTLLDVTFLPPSLHLDLVSDEFSGRDIDGRTSLVEDWLFNNGTPVGVVKIGAVRLPVLVNLLTRAEHEKKRVWSQRSSTANWVSAFLESTNSSPKKPINLSTKFIHFYGYKGGQGRSTVLGLLAKALADDGYRVLAVDADIEAPALDIIFSASADNFSSTLMGLCGWSEQLTPLPGAYAGNNGGRVDLIPCRPRIESADIDFSIFTAIAPLDTRIYERAAAKLLDYLTKSDVRYDVVITDHRTGIASSVLPLVDTLPGSILAFVRYDFNSLSAPTEMRKVLKAILHANPGHPSAFLSFSLDPNRSSTSRSPSESRMREEFLGDLADAMNVGVSADEQVVQVPELFSNWIDWYHDRALLDPVLPPISRLQTDNLRSLTRLRECFGLPLEPAEPKVELPVFTRASSLSGAIDAGQFINVPEVEKLFIQGNAISYILGRKGTGKTRLLRELARHKHGRPILVAADFTEFDGLQSLSLIHI